MPALLNAGLRVRDEQLPLVLVPSKNKAKATLYFVKRQRGMKSATWHKIGVWPDASVQRVKDVAKQLLADSSLGIAIATAADQHRYNGYQRFSDVLDWYVSDPLSNASLSQSRVKNVGTLIKLHIKPLCGSCELATMGEPDIKTRLVDPMVKDGYAISYIDLACRTARQALTAAVRGKVIAVNPLSAMTMKSFTTAKVKPKKAAYHAGQLPDVIAAIGREPRHWVRVMAALILLHAMRVDEVASLRWSENVDLLNGMLRLSAEQTKNGQSHILPMTDMARELLRYHKRMQRKFGHRGAWLLPAKRNPKLQINSTYASYLVSSCLANGTAHDLRKIARQWWQENGVDFYVGELLLNHKSGVLSQTYIQTLLVEPCRDALKLWHGELQKHGLMEAVCKS